MVENKNTQGASSSEDRALAEGEAAGASSSLRDCDPSRMARNILVDLFDLKVGLVHKRADPLTSEAIVGWRVRIQEGFRGLQFMLAVEKVLLAQAMEARQDGDAEGGSVVDDSAVTEGDVPHPDSATPSGDGVGASSTPGEVERLLDKLEGSIRAHEALAGDPYSHRKVEKLADDIEAARTALLSHISTGGRGEGAAPDWLVEFVRAAANTVAQTTLPGSALREVAERAFAWAVIEGQALSTADATNPQDQE